MKKLIYLFILIMCVSCIACNEHSNGIVDRSLPKGTTMMLKAHFYGDFESIYERFDSVLYIVTDTAMVHDTIISHIEKVECEEFYNLLKAIHSGKHVEIINSGALAIARRDNNQIRVNYILKQNKEVKEKGLKAQIEIIQHLDTCSVCKLLKNDICPSCNNNHFLKGLQCSNCGQFFDEEFYRYYGHI